jgi:hypothetical protein
VAKLGIVSAPKPKQVICHITFDLTAIIRDGIRGWKVHSWYPKAIRHDPENSDDTRIVIFKLAELYSEVSVL